MGWGAHDSPLCSPVVSPDPTPITVFYSLPLLDNDRRYCAAISSVIVNRVGAYVRTTDTGSAPSSKAVSVRYLAMY